MSIEKRSEKREKETHSHYKRPVNRAIHYDMAYDHLSGVQYVLLVLDIWNIWEIRSKNEEAKKKITWKSYIT